VDISGRIHDRGRKKWKMDDGKCFKKRTVDMMSLSLF
jgi:hypothetical protein